MKIKKQFIILSSMIISIPLLCSVFIFIHTYIHSPNRYLLKGSTTFVKDDFPQISEEDLENLKISIKMLPQDVQALLYKTSERKVVYSTMPEIKVGTIIEREDISNSAIESSDKYYYQFSRLPSFGSDILLVTRLSLERIQNEKKTKNYLKILFAVIVITIISLIIISFISKQIFEGLNEIEKSSFQLAEGDFNKPITQNIDLANSNEFTRIMVSLEKMRCTLMDMQTSKNHFITGISHDLRTPVAVIKGYTEAIMDDVITEPADIKKSMDLIEHKTTQLEEMINTLINFVKLNNTEIKEKLVPQSITSLIKTFAKYVEITGQVFKRRVHTDIQILKDIKVPLNDQLVHRSFENLFSNAIRYTKEDDLIEVIAYTVESKDHNYIILQIKDSGSGIEKKDLDYIFDMFYRGTNSRQEEGMGIGLSVVKSIMDTHGWEISVESQPGKGTCFIIRIPY